MTALPSFPILTGLTWPEIRTPIWMTIRQDAISGRRTGLQMRSYPQYRFQLKYDLLRSDANGEWQTLLGFFNSVGGAAQPFIYSAPYDQTVTAQPLGTGDGVTTQFQLVRALGGFVEPVYAPVGPLTILVNAVPTPNFTESGGLITFDTPPANGAVLTWTGGYGWICRFDRDDVDLEYFMTDFWSLGSIAMTSEKP